MFIYFCLEYFATIFKPIKAQGVNLCLTIYVPNLSYGSDRGLSNSEKLSLNWSGNLFSPKFSNVPKAAGEYYFETILFVYFMFTPAAADKIIIENL